MINFILHQFAIEWARITEEARLWNLQANSGGSAGFTQVTASDLLRLESLTGDFEKVCESLGLERSSRIVSNFRTAWTHRPSSWHEINNRISDIVAVIQTEINEQRLALILSRKVPFFEQDALFGTDVNEKFPSAATEIKSAGNCMALDLNTAAIFHFMRASEVGLRALAGHLKVTDVITRNGTRPVEFAMWGDIITHIQKEMPTLVTGNSEHEKEHNKQFYKDVLLHCDAIKDLWRNPVSHGTKIYNECGARVVLGHTERFMARLATRIKET